jgi:hypothetical protein
MKVYLAGNFPQLADIEKERKTCDLTISINGTYNRLITYFYIDKSDNVFKVKDEIDE